MKDWIKLTQNKYTNEQIIDLEQSILFNFDFQILTTSSYRVLERNPKVAKIDTVTFSFWFKNEPILSRITSFSCYLHCYARDFDSIKLQKRTTRFSLDQATRRTHHVSELWPEKLQRGFLYSFRANFKE